MLNRASNEPSAPGLLASLRRLMSTSIGILHTRLALAGIELEEEIQRLMKVLMLALSVLLFAALGLLMFSLTVVFAFDAEHRLWAMAGLTVMYAALAGVLWHRLQGLLALRPAIFETTLAELEKDREVLRRATRHENAESSEAMP